MSDPHSPAAAQKQLILMCVSTLLSNLLRGEFAVLDNVEVISTASPEAYAGEPPTLILIEVTEATESTARTLLEMATPTHLVLIGPLRPLSAPSARTRDSRGDGSRQTKAPGGWPGRRDVCELSADVSVAEIARVCRERLAGGARLPPIPAPTALGSAPFQMFLGTRENASFPSLPAPLFPTSAPPSSNPSQRPSSDAPPPGPTSEDALHESLFQLDAHLRNLLEEAERKVATRVSPRVTSPPDPVHTAHEAGFILTPEVRAALEGRVGAYEPARRKGRTSLTPNSSWVTRTGHGQVRPRTGTSEVSEATRDGETSIPTSAADSRPAPLPPGISAVSLQTESTSAFTSKQADPPKPGTENLDETPPSFEPDAADQVPDSSDELPSLTANQKANADTTPPRRPPTRDAVRPPGLTEQRGDSDPGHEMTARLSSEATPSAAFGNSRRAMDTSPVEDAAAHSSLSEDVRPTRPPGIRTLPASGAKGTSGPHHSVVPPHSSNEALGGESLAPVSPSGRRISDVPPLREGDAIAVVARAIRTRYTGAIAVEAEGSVRRIVMRDGDFVTAASGIARESLLGFLVSHGTVAPDVATKLGHRLPNFGRHAGAALIAAGHLTQEQMWPSLRAHAEHIIALVLQVREGLAGFEDQVPDRLAAEPAVFGGATGAEVLIELIRRTVPPELALARLGGPHCILGPGMAHGLLEECALTQREHETLERLHQAPIEVNLRSLPYPEFASVLYALVQLRVLSAAPKDDEQKQPVQPSLDEQAVRELVANRKALVEEADYFQLLGVSPSATGYDIHRAYEALKRTFDASVVLTAATADLGDDIDLIHVVLDEAFEILQDQVRRERYRKAILSTPGASIP